MGKNQILSKNHIKKKNIIRVAILAEEPFFWGSRKYYHEMILDKYSWTIHNVTYEFSVTYLYDADILKGKLTRQNFDALVIPGGGVGNNEALLKGFTIFSKVRKFKRNIADFVKNGGGLLGICGGAAFITDLKVGDGRTPTTVIERLYQKSSLGISGVSSYFRILAFPLLYPFQYRHPENVGNSAYAFSFAPGQTIDGRFIMTTGIPLDLQIKHDNPIFSDYPKDIRCIRWWAGQALLPQKNSDRDIQILARFPPSDVSANESTRIYAWRYIGGFRGIVRAVIKAFKLTKKHNLGLSFVPLFTFYLAGDWESTDTIIELDLANKPCITAEIYPNKHAGRIILNTVHAEYLIWKGGYIIQNQTKDMQCIGKGLHQWKDIYPLSSTLQEELTYNWWILRRLVAWVGKVPDADLPPQEMGQITEKIKEMILQPIYWDGSLIHQLKSI